MKFHTLNKDITSFLLLLTFCISNCYAENLETMSKNIANINVFLEHTANKKDVFQNESFVYDCYLVINNAIILKNMQLLSLPSFNSFKHKEIHIDSLSYYDTLIDGISFKKALLHRYMLTAPKAGSYNIEPVVFETNIDIPIDNKYLDQYAKEAPNGYYSYIHTIKTDVSIVKINELPPNNNRNYYNNDVTPIFVGDFEMNCSVNKLTATSNERVQMMISIVGIGDLSVPYAPTLNKTEGLKSNIYKVLDSVNIDRNEIVSRKIYEIDLFATDAKEHTVYPIEILCFSPSRKDYYVLTSDAITLFFMNKNNELKEKNDNNSYVLWIILFIFIGLTVLVGLFFFYSKRLSKVVNKSQKSSTFESKIVNDIALYSSDIAKQYLSNAYKLIDKDIDEFLRELLLGVNEYILQHFQINSSVTNNERVVEKLVDNGVPQSIADDYLFIHKKIDTLRFSKEKFQYSRIDKEDIFIRVEKFVNNLEQVIE